MSTIANTLGRSVHVSPLLRKARKLGLATPDSLLRLAVARGCFHYAPTDFDVNTVNDPGRSCLSDEELGIAMISGAQESNAQLMRCAAQLLSGVSINPLVLVRLARMERCEPVLCYIAEQARQWDQLRSEFWGSVLAALPPAIGKRSDDWPHPSRFMIQAGYRRGGGNHKPAWLRPRLTLAR